MRGSLVHWAVLWSPQRSNQGKAGTIQNTHIAAQTPFSSGKGSLHGKGESKRLDLNFLAQQCPSLWQLKYICGSAAPGSPSSPSPPQEDQALRKKTGEAAEPSDKAQLPRGSGKWLVLHMKTTVPRSRPPQLANSPNSSFLSRIPWLAGKIAWCIMWKERSSCLRKPVPYTMS